MKHRSEFDPSYFKKDKLMNFDALKIDDDFIFQGNVLERLTLLAELVRNKIGVSNEEYESIYSYAYNCFVAGQHEQAKDIFKVLLLVNQKEERSFLGLGATLQKLGHPERAISIYQAGHIAVPSSVKLLFNLGLAYLEMDNLQDAESAFLYASVVGYKNRKQDKEKMFEMAERMWKMARKKQSKELIGIQDALIQVD